MLFKLYPDQRRPAGHLAQEVDNMLSVNGNPTLVAQVLHKEGLAVRVKDIHNRKRKRVSEVLSALSGMDTTCIAAETEQPSTPALPADQDQTSSTPNASYISVCLLYTSDAADE